MIVAIVGSRNYRPVELIRSVLDRLEAKHTVLTIVSGGEPTGVDTAARDECLLRGYHECTADPHTITHLILPLHFSEILPKDGSARAKFARNSEIVRHSLMVIALFAPGPRSPGTSDTVSKAQKAGLPVYAHHEGAWETLAKAQVTR